MDVKIPKIGETYERSDGEIVIVVGLILDDDGDFCVEYETESEAEVVGLHHWLGVARTEDFPHPRRFTLVEMVEDEGDGEGEPKTEGEPTRDNKLRVLSHARDFNRELKEDEPVKVADPEVAG